MGSREGAIPVMRGFVVRVILVLWALVLPTSASAQYPTNLSICLPGPTGC